MLLKQADREKQLFKENISGEVISIQKGLKGVYHLEIVEKDKIRSLGYNPQEDQPLVSMYDSICKETNSNTFYIKKHNTPNFVRLHWGDPHISGKWDK
jgi:hypothetical protein